MPLNKETKTKVEPSLFYCLLIAGGIIVGFIPFPRVLALCEIQTTLFRIWTWVAECISYNNNCYAISACLVFRFIKGDCSFIHYTTVDTKKDCITSLGLKLNKGLFMVLDKNSERTEPFSCYCHKF